MIYCNGKESTPKLNGVDLSRVMYSGKQIWPKIVTEIALADTKAGDVLLWDKINQKKLFTSSDNLNSYPAESYTPIGVVVIPASHNVYGDGSCGVMSLKAMNYSTPSTGGTSEQFMYWGVYGTNISGLRDLDQVPTGNTSNGIPTSSASYSYLPSDKFSGTQCAHDTDAYYNYSSYIPSPYLTDGSRNPGYYQTSSPSSSSNALADFDGIGNTAKIITQRGTKDYNSWTPGRETSTDYPAASCCDMFHTEGTQQGDWYLPACGELGYIMPPFNKINDAIDKMRTAYGSSVGVELDTNDYYWSSTEYSSNRACPVGTGIGYVGRNDKNSLNYVRAFLKVSPLDDLSGISPESASDGVYVYANNGKLYNPSDWDTANNDLAVGVAIVTDNCKFVIAPEQNGSTQVWSKGGAYNNISGVTTTTNSTTAKADYQGVSNSQAIVTKYGNSTDYAAGWCQNYTFKNGKKGYLGSCGEWQEAYNNKSEIDACMSLIGGTAINTSAYHWTSTQYDSYHAWILFWSGGSVSRSPKDHNYRVRAFAAL